MNLYVIDAGQLPYMLKFENKYNNCWLNSMLQMLLASGHIIETVRRFGSVEADLAPGVPMVVSKMLNQLINRSQIHDEIARLTIDDGYIRDQINYLRGAGVDIRLGKQNCLFDFFRSAIIPTLLFYNIDLQYVIDTSIKCSSCHEITSIDEQTWDFVFVNQVIQENTLDDIMADLFGPISRKQVCPKCIKLELNQSSLSIMNCPKNLFVRFDPAVATGRHRPKLTPHVNFAKIISNNVTYTRSYSRYTLQSFIVFDGKDDNGHYMTFARYKGEWYRLNDMNITLLRSSNIFEDSFKNQPVMMAHYTRPSEIDVFSIALWNVFTNFSPTIKTLPPTLSLNDATSYFAKHHIIEDNPLNFVAVKFFDCSTCKAGKIGITLLMN